MPLRNQVIETEYDKVIAPTFKGAVNVRMRIPLSIAGQFSQPISANFKWIARSLLRTEYPQRAAYSIEKRQASCAWIVKTESDL